MSGTQQPPPIPDDAAIDLALFANRTPTTDPVRDAIALSVEDRDTVVAYVNALERRLIHLEHHSPLTAPSLAIALQRTCHAHGVRLSHAHTRDSPEGGKRIILTTRPDQERQPAVEIDAQPLVRTEKRPNGVHELRVGDQLVLGGTNEERIRIAAHALIEGLESAGIEVNP